MIQVILWWVAIQVLGWIALPTAFALFRWLPDRGYSFSKILGLLIASYFLWLGSSLGVLRNNAAGVISAVLLLAGLSALSYYLRIRGSGESIATFLRQRRSLVLSGEALFTLAFVLWSLVRAYASFKIQPSGGEKFMEIAFLNGTLNSANFPPLDPWLSGYSISYYYFGYVMMAFVTRMTGVLSEVAFDLYDALLFGLTLLGAFGVVSNLVAGTRTSGNQLQGEPIRFGLLGALLVGVMGNLEGLLESLRSKGWLTDAITTWIDVPDLINAQTTGSFDPTSPGWFWWWRASRVIQDYDLAGQPMGISPITEFPFFSFLLGDNHPHKLALPFVLLGIALALNLILRQVASTSSAATGGKISWWNPAAACLDGDHYLFLLTALGIGALGFLNTWDMPIYIALTVLAYGAGMWLVRRRLDADIWIRCIILGIGIGLGALVFYIFFYLSFSSQAGGILPYVYPPTRLSQYLIMFGPFVFILAWFLAAHWVSAHRRQQQKPAVRPVLRSWAWVILVCAVLLGLGLVMALLAVGGVQGLNAVLSDASVQTTLGGLSLGEAARATLISRLQNPWLFITLSLFLGLAAANFLKMANRSELETGGPQVSSETAPSQLERQFPSMPVETSSAFVLLMLFLGIALTFSVEFFYLRDNFGLRMNTVFKFFYQGWVLMALSSAYSCWWLLHSARSALNAAGRTVFFLSAALLIGAGLVYPLFGAWSRAGGFSGEANLNAASEVARDNPDDWAVIEWLRENAGDSGSVPVILEAPADSYNYEGRISAFTGFPTVLGWALHEGQWRGSYEEQSRREPQIAEIYTGTDPAATLAQLHELGVSYVVLGNAETNYINTTCQEHGGACSLDRTLRKFASILTPIFQQGSTTLYAVP